MLAQIQPSIFKLKDLLGDDVDGFFYKEQLTKAAAPDYSKDFFLIEKILKRKTIRKKKYIFAKFLWYPR